MKTHTKYCPFSTKVILNFFSGAPKLSLIPKVYHSPDTKNAFLQSSVWDDKLLSTPKITKFLASSLPKFYETAPSNAIP